MAQPWPSQAFEAPLPSGWSEHLDPEGRVYFFSQVGLKMLQWCAGDEALDETLGTTPFFWEMIFLFVASFGDLKLIMKSWSRPGYKPL